MSITITVCLYVISPWMWHVAVARWIGSIMRCVYSSDWQKSRN